METLATRPDDSPPTIRVQADLTGERYETLETLGRGGMGEVNLCRDRYIGREVAIKRELAGRPSDPRFLREALVQGQLEHPAVVPVYDVTVGLDGAPYFVMRRVRGESLRRVLDDPAQVNPRKLLSAMSRVCLAVDFAHAHGVVHRDLKPANLMLGVWGEVYVLDWGIAKVVGAPDVLGPATDARISGTGPQTAAGSVLGTPGYMAPEQLGGEASVATDVYAIGAILFEILSGEHLHPGRTAEERLTSTALGQGRVRERLEAKAIAPELVALCERATHVDAAARFASARDVHDTLERYLEGDRDLEMRRAASLRHASRAEMLADGDRAEAMRELGQALAFDPHNARAVELLRSLLAQVPATLPAQAQAEIDAAEEADTRISARNGLRALPSLFIAVGLLALLGVRDRRSLVIYVACIVGALMHGLLIRMRSARTTLWSNRAALLLLLLGIPFIGRAFGPLIYTPVLVTAFGTPFMLRLAPRERRQSILPMAVLAFAGPLALEYFGVLEPSYALRDGTLVVLPHLVAFSRFTIPVLGLITFLSIMVPLGMFGLVGDELRRSRRRTTFQTWQLRNLV